MLWIYCLGPYMLCFLGASLFLCINASTYLGYSFVLWFWISSLPSLCFSYNEGISDNQYCLWNLIFISVILEHRHWSIGDHSLSDLILPLGNSLCVWLAWIFTVYWWANCLDGSQKPDKVKINYIYCFLSISQTVILSQKEIRLVWQDLIFQKPCWVLPSILFSSRYFQIDLPYLLGNACMP